jgi:hypothetical protein
MMRALAPDSQVKITQKADTDAKSGGYYPERMWNYYDISDIY